MDYKRFKKEYVRFYLISCKNHAGRALHALTLRQSPMSSSSFNGVVPCAVALGMLLLVYVVFLVVDEVDVAITHYKKADPHFDHEKLIQEHLELHRHHHRHHHLSANHHQFLPDDDNDGVGGGGPVITSTAVGKGALRKEIDHRDQLCGIVTYFNPAKYKNKFVNYDLFKNRLKDQGLKTLITIELQFVDANGNFGAALPE